jgi:hypothetical protein
VKKMECKVEQTGIDLVSWSPTIRQDIEGEVQNESYADLRLVESEMLLRIQTRVKWEAKSMQAALEAGVVGLLPDKLCAGITGMKALCEIYDTADRLVLAQRNEDRLRGEMKELGVTQQAIASIADQIKHINRNMSTFAKSGDKAAQKAEREKRATIKRVQAPKARQDIALKKEAICGPSRAWSRPAIGNGGEDGGGEGKQGNDGDEQVQME